MLGVQLFALLARCLTVVVCWLILTGVPLIFFKPPLGPDSLKPFLGLFYALMLLLGTVVTRSWGGSGLLLLAFPFMILFTALGMKPLLVENAGPSDQLSSLNFFALYGVVFLAWRLGRRLRSPAREDGRLL